ncbi:Glucokinase regulatory protein [Bagarius yarrelli]|uniref:Glucokinase regulatory protein n=1 Tax=Bagarius yarrelli TaxID=175774 RepID=A0A556U915_BAGYA|nr:Glucokinase regulatory protein [Bagarius yarrelli]
MDVHWQQSSYEPYLPVTEKSNPITRDIDRANPKEIVQMLQQCDAEIFEKTSHGNPMYQPEAISGSTRMKGGGATKIILETILLAGHQAAFSNKAVTVNGILHSLNMFEKVHQITYRQPTALANLVQKAAISCILDFIPGFEDIRGFVGNGFSEMNNTEGDLSSLGPHFIIDHKDFVDTILPNLSDHDTVIFLYSENDNLNDVLLLAKNVRQHTSNLHAIKHELIGLGDPKQYWELSTKLCLNVISTGAHILIGKVYMNYMIDLRVTNSKLYRRAIHILQRFTGSTEAQCETALLRALYDVEELTDEMVLNDVTQHTLVAKERANVVPIALVMLQSGRTIAEAKAYLDTYSVIRDAVAACQKLL